MGDLVKSSTEGIPARNADGEDLVLFTDVVGFVSDYHEVGHVLDVVGVNGTAPCNLCSFMRFKGPKGLASRYAYTTDIHSADSCFARHAERTKALRSSGISDVELNALGLNGNDDAARKASPFVSFSRDLKNAFQKTTIPMTEHNVPVVNPKFDPYRSMLVAPDHLLAGNAINILTLAFKSLPTATRRNQVDGLICSLLRTNRLVPETRIYNSSTSSMYTASISATFSILLIASPVFKEVVDNLSCPQEISNVSKRALFLIVQNLSLFSKLVSKTYWYQKLHVDGLDQVERYNREDGTAHMADLERHCKMYIQNCNNLCRSSTMAGKELDKPNIHRLLELYMHSIPAMGHVQHFAELVFECAHQPLKQAMADSNGNDAHIQGVDHIINNDWKNRLSSALYSVDGSCEMEEKAIASVVNLICGRRIYVHNYVTKTEGEAEMALGIVKNGLLKHVIGAPSSNINNDSRRTVWNLSDRTVDVDGAFHATMTCIAADFIVEAGPNDPQFFEKACRMKKSLYGFGVVTSHSRPHDMLSNGSVVQALVFDDEPQIVLTFAEDERVAYNDELHVAYFAIETFMKMQDAYEKTHFAIVKRCQFTSGFIYVDIHKPFQLLKLTDSVRRVGLVHACHNDRTTQCLKPEENIVSCTASIMEGNIFYCLSRHDGYPPRMA